MTDSQIYGFVNLKMKTKDIVKWQQHGITAEQMAKLQQFGVTFAEYEALAKRDLSADDVIMMKDKVIPPKDYLKLKKKGITTPEDIAKQYLVLKNLGNYRKFKLNQCEMEKLIENGIEPEEYELLRKLGLKFDDIIFMKSAELQSDEYLELKRKGLGNVSITRIRESNVPVDDYVGMKKKGFGIDEMLKVIEWGMSSDDYIKLRDMGFTDEQITELKQMSPGLSTNDIIDWHSNGLTYDEILLSLQNDVNPADFLMLKNEGLEWTDVLALREQNILPCEYMTFIEMGVTDVAEMVKQKTDAVLTGEATESNAAMENIGVTSELSPNQATGNLATAVMADGSVAPESVAVGLISVDPAAVVPAEVVTGGSAAIGLGPAGAVSSGILPEGIVSPEGIVVGDVPGGVVPTEGTALTTLSAEVLPGKLPVIDEELDASTSGQGIEPLPKQPTQPANYPEMGTSIQPSTIHKKPSLSSPALMSVDNKPTEEVVANEQPVKNNLAVVSSATGTPISLIKLLNTSFIIADRVLIMSKAGDYFVFLYDDTYFLYEGCTCGVDVIRRWNLKTNRKNLRKYGTVELLVDRLIAKQRTQEAAMPKKEESGYKLNVKIDLGPPVLTEKDEQTLSYARDLIGQKFEKICHDAEQILDEFRAVKKLLESQDNNL